MKIIVNGVEMLINGGIPGKNATLNGVEAATLVAGSNVTITTEDSAIVISAANPGMSATQVSGAINTALNNRIGAIDSILDSINGEVV